MILESPRLEFWTKLKEMNTYKRTQRGSVFCKRNKGVDLFSMKTGYDVILKLMGLPPQIGDFPQKKTI